MRQAKKDLKRIRKARRLDAKAVVRQAEALLGLVKGVHAAPLECCAIKSMVEWPDYDDSVAYC